jgi:nucleotide-binding universal stress UspA family protein
MKVNTIVCPLDFSTVSDKAFDYACLFAEKLNAELLLVHVVEEENVPRDPIAGSPYTTPGGHEKTINQKLETLRDDAERAHGINVRTRMEYGEVDEVIAKIGNEESMDLIVMGTSGAQSISEIFQASNTVRVIEKSNCSVLVIPEDTEYSVPDKWAFASALDDEFELLATQVVHLTSAFRAKLDVLNIAKRKREDAASTLAHNFGTSDISFTQIESKNVLEGINDYVERTNPDLLIVVEHPHKKWDWLYKEDKIGKIVESANFPILVLQAEKSH